MTAGDVERAVTVTNLRGLHARASAKFVKLAETFACDIEVEKDGMVVPATSIMGLMMLAAGPGSEILVRARGEDAAAAVTALTGLVESRFGEE
ncbi:MAG: HPr family phosphocarrier protein [Alphaproteobacteria bacterium]|nr:HPr family phosphocarrier protein [Alphaproteobacteria bacterium]